jgi:tetratricopeptide (TPR) repeat protein
MRGPWPFVLLAGLLLAVPVAHVAWSFPLDGSLPIIHRPKFDPQSEYAAGMAAMAEPDYRGAKDHFEHLLTVSPDHPLALYELGRAEAALGDLKGAARDYQAALRSNPNLFEAVRQLALTDARLGRDDQARVQLVRLKRFEQTCASACAQAADITAAIAEVETSLSAQAKSPAG